MMKTRGPEEGSSRALQRPRSGPAWAWIRSKDQARRRPGSGPLSGHEGQVLGGDSRRDLPGVWLVIAVDTNLLVHAHRADSELHLQALHALVGLAEGRSQWSIPWPCAHEFLAIVTHPRIYVPASTSREALGSLAVWLESPNCTPIGEGSGYLDVLACLVSTGKAVGGCSSHAPRTVRPFGSLKGGRDLKAVRKAPCLSGSPSTRQPYRPGGQRAFAPAVGRP
jgi:hypothetical protein